MDHRDVPIPKRLRHRPLDERGYLITFVTFIDQKTRKPDFHIVEVGRVMQCAKERLCGICGEKLERIACFVGGDEAIKNRIFSDPPMHVECARYAMKVCPYLSNSNARHTPGKKHEGQLTITNPLAGKVRPNKLAIYMTKFFEPILVRENAEGIPAPNFRVGKPYHIEWFS